MKSSYSVTSILLITWFLGVLLVSLFTTEVYIFEIEMDPALFFWAGAVLLSSSLVCLWTYSKKYSHLMIVVFISAFFIASLKFMRFYFYGTDLIGEYFVASETQGLNRWPIERIRDGSLVMLELDTVTGHRYFSCLSVTILPTIITQITGISMMNVFKVMIPTISALAAICAFLVMREVFNQKIACLSTIVFIFHHIYLGEYTQMIRQEIALVFFFLTLYFLFKKERKPLLAILTMFMLATAHYAVIYFIILGLSVLIVSKRLYDLKNVRILRFLFSTSCAKKEVRHAVLSKELFISMLVVCFSWLIFIAYPIFSANLMMPIKLFRSITGAETPKYGFLRQYVVFSSLGISHSILRWLTQALSIAGFFIALKACKDEKTFSFTVMSGTMLLLPLVWATLPYTSLAFELDRTYAIVLPFFSAFVALAIIKFKKKSKKWGAIFSILIIVLMFSDALEFPIFFPKSSLSTSHPFAHIYGASDLSFTEWLKIYTKRHSIFASDVRGCIIAAGFADRRCLLLDVQNSADVIPLIEDVNFEYFICIRTEGYLSFERSQSNVFLLNHTETNQVYNISQLNCVYDNGRFSLISKLEGS